ncbi:MAG TPA: BMP family ABC transporter substrate-binding protein [Gaiellaceae bacterium]|nr:BMP family ABC transporter substrate-binding protein [Gaiellaceae bacterium]
MKVRKHPVWILAALMAMLVAALATTASTSSAQGSFQAAFITDTAGLNDKSFNHLGNLGRLKAQKDLGIQTKVYISATEADYLPNSVAASQWGAKAVVMNGFLLAAATSTAAKQFPDIKWAITDFPRVALTDQPANAYGLTFKSEESGYLVGYLAAEMAKARIGAKGRSSGKLVLSAVGGKKIPSVDNWIAGYRAGAKAVDKRFKVLIDYSGDFPPSTAPKCKEIALKHISQGAQAVFQVAGGCGLGALQAAKQKGVWGIGVDADQAYLGKHIMTSGVKRVDTAVYTFYKQAQAGTLGPGKDLTFNLKNKGQDVGKISPRVPGAFITKMNAQKALIIKGKIKPPATL